MSECNKILHKTRKGKMYKIVLKMSVFSIFQ